MATLLNHSTFRFKRFNSVIKLFGEIPVSRWYYQLKASKHYDELTLQRVLKYKFKTLLPNHEAIYYDRNIVNKNNKKEKRKPDFLLWDNKYENWYIIEVELENHKFKHIDEQLNTFYHGDYSDVQAISKYVKEKHNGLDVAKFEKLITNERPQLILMADKIHCNWRADFSNYDCLFSTIQVYVDEDDNFIHRISGDFPQEYSGFTYCSLNKHVRALDIHNERFFDQFNFTDGQSVKIYYQNEADYWDFISDDKSVTLVYPGDFLPLEDTQTRWRIILNNRNQLHIIK